MKLKFSTLFLILPILNFGEGFILKEPIIKTTIQFIVGAKTVYNNGYTNHFQSIKES